MTADPAFVDTNILVYAVAADDVHRSPIAQELLRTLIQTAAFCTSTQVLQEVVVTLTRKVKMPLTAEQALRYLDQIAVCPVVLLDYAAIRDAVQVSVNAQISFWYGLVVV